MEVKCVWWGSCCGRGQLQSLFRQIKAFVLQIGLRVDAGVSSARHQPGGTILLFLSQEIAGAEPGGGGYIAQRMLASKDENHAIGATFFFNIMHYALRPWPWILVALASLVVFLT